MSREIKFRAWDEQGKYWIPEGECIIAGDGVISVLDPDLRDTWHDNGPITICFFTGLKDKNGVEIYEGDIVTWETRSQYPQRDTVIFNDGMFMLKIDEESVFNHIYCKHNIEVIGNIYENPELLEDRS